MHSFVASPPLYIYVHLSIRPLLLNEWMDFPEYAISAYRNQIESGHIDCSRNGKGTRWENNDADRRSTVPVDRHTSFAHSRSGWKNHRNRGSIHTSNKYRAPRVIRFSFFFYFSIRRTVNMLYFAPKIVLFFALFSSLFLAPFLAFIFSHVFKLFSRFSVFRLVCVCFYYFRRCRYQISWSFLSADFQGFSPYSCCFADVWTRRSCKL